MPIKVFCTECEKTITAPDKMAGHSAKCPGCGAPITIPTGFGRTETALLDPGEDERACPYCSEKIKASAVKCKHCGEFLDGSLPRRADSGPRRGRDRSWSPGLAAVLSFVVPGLGQMYKGQIGFGIMMLLVTCLLYITVILGLVTHVWLIYDAYNSDPK